MTAHAVSKLQRTMRAMENRTNLIRLTAVSDSTFQKANMEKTTDETIQKKQCRITSRVTGIKTRLDKLEHGQIEIHSKITITVNDLENKIKQKGFLK
jgi:hypothetical protein